MPSDDRDRQLEKALARHLRNSWHERACPDVETLAAYQERTLSLEEMTRWKQHIAACPRCQETLALVEESNVQQGAEENREMLKPVGEMFAAVPAARLQWQEELSAAAALPVLGGTATKPAPKRRAALRWVVPVGALAAGLLVWVALRETHPYPVLKPGIEVAANPPAAAVPAPSGSAPQRIPSSKEDSTDATVRALQELHEQSATALETEPAGAFEKKAPSRGVAREPATPRPDKDKAFTALDALSRSTTPPAPPAPSVNNYAGQNRELPATEAVPSTSAAPHAVAANNAPAAGKLPANQKTKMPSARTENLEASSASVAIPQSVNDVLPEGGVIIMAPVEAYSWRVGPGGKIEHSTDSSRTWMLQKSGVTTDLTAGSATSGKVCWVVGKAGTILLTTDRGRHWKQLTSPTKEDLAGVDALDEKRASIWTASRTKSFETNDGGGSWAPVGSK
jgi:uncharacterized protein with PIN domain